MIERAADSSRASVKIRVVYLAHWSARRKDAAAYHNASAAAGPVGEVPSRHGQPPEPRRTGPGQQLRA